VKSLLDYLILPKTISDHERRYLQQMNRIALLFFYGHLPVMVAIAALNGTKPLFAALFTSLVLVGPTLAYFGFKNPRSVARSFGFVAMIMGGLLVHFGQGPMQIEMHFYFFVLIALMAVFADPLAILVAAVTVAGHHAVMYFVLPQSVFNYQASIWVVAVHALFVVLESVAACFIARSFFDNVIGLEKIVERRTLELDSRNADMRLVLANVGQGFLTIDRDRRMSVERSAVLETWLGPAAGETDFAAYVGRTDPTAGTWFTLGFEAVVDDMLPIELAIEQMPKRMKADGKILEFSYRPIQKDGVLEKVLVVVSDVTSDVERARFEAEQHEMMAVVDRILKDKAGFIEFFADATETVSALEDGHLSDPSAVKRAVHTLKGSCAIFGLTNMSSFCHAVEDEMAETGELSAAQRSELAKRWGVLSKKIGSFVDGGQVASAVEVDAEEFAAIVRAIVKGMPRADVLRKLQSWKLEPARRRFVGMAEQVRAIADRLGKEGVDVRVEANGVRFPREGWAPLWSALTHALRNAVDHGLESTSDRESSGKIGAGVITLATEDRGDRVVIAVEDDGRGIDWETVTERARSLGLSTETQDDLVEALFADGVTTKSSATEYSGRGVGMGALRQACRALGGELTLRTQKGKGTRLELSLPSPHARSEIMVAASLAPAALVGVA
jgi:two-component system, chemotaxis family, sensor kinase CheA